MANLAAMRFYPLTGEYLQHFSSIDREDCDGTNYQNPDPEKGFITIGLFKDTRPYGLAWQWKSERTLEGFLYGEVDEEGKFTGDGITFLYPDLLTGRYIQHSHWRLIGPFRAWKPTILMP